MIGISPPWLEIAIVTSLAILLAPAIQIMQIQHRRKFRQLDNATITPQQAYNLIQTWAQRSARSNVIAAPLWEEVVFRGMPYLIIQEGHLIPGLILALSANLTFAAWHKTTKTGFAKVRDKAKFFGLGCLYAAPLPLGILSLSVLAHAAWNYANGNRAKLLRNTNWSCSPGTTLDVGFYNKWHSTIYIR